MIIHSRTGIHLHKHSRFSLSAVLPVRNSSHLSLANQRILVHSRAPSPLKWESSINLTRRNEWPASFSCPGFTELTTGWLLRTEKNILFIDNCSAQTSYRQRRQTTGSRCCVDSCTWWRKTVLPTVQSWRQRSHCLMLVCGGQGVQPSGSTNNCEIF